MTKSKMIEITRSDLANCHNNLVEAMNKIADKTTENEGMDSKELKEVLKILYPVLSNLQDLAINNNFGFVI